MTCSLWNVDGFATVSHEWYTADFYSVTHLCLWWLKYIVKKQPTLHCLAFHKWSLEGKRHVQVNHIILSSLKKSCYRSGRVFQYQWIVMMTSSNGNIFCVTGLLCGEFTVDRWIPRTRANGAELWCFFDLRLNTQLSKQTWDWWFETPSHHYDVTVMFLFKSDVINICENMSMSLSMTNW